MVSGINSNTSQDWRVASNLKNAMNEQNATNALKAGATIKADEADSFALTAGIAAGSAALFEGIPLYRYIKNNKKINGAMTSEMTKLSERTQNALQNLKNGQGKFTERLGNYFNVINQNHGAYSEIKNITSAKAKAPVLAEEAAKKAQKAAEKPGLWNNWRAEKALKKSAEVTEKSLKPITSTMEGAKKVGIGKMMKSSGAGFLLALGGIIEGITEVYPTFKELGPEKGMKQLGKSTAKVVGDTIGFIAGQQMGMAVGSAIGTAIFPGVGTAIGGAVGLVCGMLGSTAADKLTDKVLGKSERELAQEQQPQNQKINQEDLMNNPFAVV